MNIHLTLHTGETEPVRVEVSGNQAHSAVPTYEFRPYKFGHSRESLRPCVTDDL